MSRVSGVSVLRVGATHIKKEHDRWKKLVLLG
jgi:hypothetical protein